MDFQLSALSTILEQEVLLQEDMELIELLDPSILRSTQAQQQRGGHQPARCLSGTPSIWYASYNLFLALCNCRSFFDYYKTLDIEYPLKFLQVIYIHMRFLKHFLMPAFLLCGW